MKKRNIILIGMLLILISIVIMFTKEEQQMISLDETIIDVSQFREFKGTPIKWNSGGKGYALKEYGEIAIVSEGWGLTNYGMTNTRIYQHNFLYQNKMKATLAFYLYSPNMVYRDEWPNFYHSSWNLTKEAGIKLNANRYIYYCGIGSKDGCQIWNYWAQYENYIVLFGFYDFRFGNSVDELEQYISEIDKQFSDILDK